MGLPVEVNNLMLGSLGGYTVGRSLRFRNSAQGNLSRTLSVAGNRRTLTVSAWVKWRGYDTGSASDSIFSVGPNNSTRSTGITFIGSGFSSSPGTFLNIAQFNGSSNDWQLVTTQVFRDPSAWYHIVLAIDTSQATASNRIKLYVNGVQVTSFSTANYPTQNSDTDFGSTSYTQYIGRDGYASASNRNYDGYMAEYNYIDGQALTPSSFGAYDTNGVWQPKKYSGTYGTNGFYLPFSNTTSTTTLVQDSSGNGNNWTPNNISLTAGTTYDSMIDSPTNAAGNSNGIGNYAVMNPNFVTPSTTFSNGNLTLTKTGATDVIATSTISMPSSKWYWEITITSLSASSNLGIGIIKNTATNGSWASPNTSATVYFNSGGGVYRYGSNITGTLGTTFATNDVLGLALDMDAGTLALYKNNTLIYTVSGVDTATPHYAFWDSYANGESASINFGQRPFSYTPPSGFKALNTYNLPAPSIANGAQYMAATTYTGNGTAGRVITVPNINEVGFAWVKSRSGIDDHRLANIVTGGNKHLKSNTTDAESTGTNIIQAFSSNTFTVGNDTSVNANGSTYVGWTWAAGGTGVTNTSGSITSTVSASPSSGFSIATFTGTGANATVGHGLGVAPSMIFTKQRNATGQWNVYHSSLGNGNVIYLNLTNAANPDNTYWNATSPTANVFTIGTNVNVNTNGTTYVAYCFAAVSGFSAFGKWTGNGSSDGPFVFTNFRPRFIMWKNASFGSQWILFDTSRSTYNISNGYLEPNTSDTENTASVPNGVLDILSNGFKLRTAGIDYNDSSYTYVYAAFAENPFNISRAR